ncbi:hypothetical protein [Streptomyces sp. 1222.5]|uniref:hypothetical protein n=1 Tax=Streptomyces sp. 1222.5 TaxID=1881026 RepID=UPI003D718127
MNSDVKSRHYPCNAGSVDPAGSFGRLHAIVTCHPRGSTVNSRNHIPYYRWQRHLPRLLQDRSAGLTMAGAAAAALAFGVGGAVAELSGPSADPCQRAQDIADEARPADGKVDSGIEREKAIDPAGDCLDAANECLKSGGDPGPGF